MIKILKNGVSFFFFFLLCLVFQDAFARHRDPGFGTSVAANMLEPIEVVSAFISVGCLIIGVTCFFAAIIKYFEHRRSALAVPMSTVVWLVILGFILLLLPFVYVLTGHGIPFSVILGGSDE